MTIRNVFNAAPYFFTEPLLKIINMIPDAIKLITNVEVSNLNIFFIPLKKNDHKIYIVIALSVNILNHLGIASQAFKSLVEKFPILFLLIHTPLQYIKRKTILT
ncbi:hypothetical protein FTE28_19780 [Bacillus licheniformis]|jgi:hypothetical protein|nr:hypothetical protein BSZ43_02945 [Bacillus sp. H15-1]ARC66747.1 hypothetical protein B14_03777 [Bacillus licheniformis]ASV14170.1 hypothetical protein CJO35_02955 [Bacillus sp. 1s-1]EQM29602.1 hypothetical protein N399_02925 [Bacillus licheniformis CG-B52]MBY8349156.1 hypothetical protein [Bacillus sp. PCH94]PZW84441.1 hypothetical protein DEU48_103401 [Bacillus sp. AG442]